MPFVLKNNRTTEIYTCTLINIYKIPYYGAKYWDYRQDADKEAAEFLAASNVADMDDWQIIEVEEHQLKLFNVKLKNNPQRRLFLDHEGRSTAVDRELN